MKTPQTDLLLAALRQAGHAGLTPREIRELTDIERVGARLKDLRDDGYKISKTHVGKRVYRYTLLGELSSPVRAAQKPGSGEPGADPSPDTSVEDGSAQLFDLGTAKPASPYEVEAA